MISACNDYLELEPLDSQTEAIYFKSAEDFESAANYLHTLVFDWKNGYPYGNLFDYGSDIVNYSSDWGSGLLVIPTSDDYWTKPYEWLRKTNELIEKAEEYSVPEEIAGSVGQAYFFRAWHHFSLLQRFGGVPLATYVPDTESDLVWGPRASRYEVVKQVIDDLDIAIIKLANTTVASTSNDGHVTIEAAKAFKARVCLYEATWEKYVGTSTDGDGETDGAGSAKPENYPTMDQMLSMAKNLAKEIISSGTFELWYGCESAEGTANPELYEHKSYRYLFCLEGSDSNPNGLTKASNKEAIFRTVWDETNRRAGLNLTATWPASFTRKLADMYLCRDGLPIHLSPTFMGFTEMNAEYENRDYRALAVSPSNESWNWGWGMYGTGADYSVDITSLSSAIYQSFPDLTNGGSAPFMGGGDKFRSERNSMSSDGDESYDYMFIRLAEIYLIYAEAACELGDGVISDADLDYSLNRVRARGGVAPLNAALLAEANTIADANGYGRLTYIGEIRRERATELYAEGHRIFDLCRWNVAVEALAGEPKTFGYISYNGVDSWVTTYVNPNTGNSVYDESSFTGNPWLDHEITYEYDGYTPTMPGAYIGEQASNRQFSKKNYLMPIPSDQLKLNSTLVQNPGW